MAPPEKDNARGQAGEVGKAKRNEHVDSTAPGAQRKGSATTTTIHAPVFPKPNSIRESALLALVAGPIRQSGFKPSWRLAAYVRFLRDDGWAIISREVIENGRTVAEYLLDLQDGPTRAAAALYRKGRRCAA
ncbi:hypothetical protein [Thauera sp. Sel9]|uniref:hypothetical protein n=1 Tax=Thauera sp. Sel9 TaxID=2974299 RepID=UPI0021E1120D|nr:hypothetical protein [Thauera sp. Sel9]MCV2218900.1 hypothetical protein [Thauera sp. Sel9]